MLDLNNLALFVQVVDAASFAAAGRSLGMPANTLSRRVQQLEDELGIRLLQRSTRKLGLTAAGQALYAQCAPNLARIHAAQQALSEAGREPAGMLRIAAPADFFEHVAMESVSEFLQRYPKLQLDFRLGDAQADLIGEGIDVAIRAGELTDASLVARKLGSDQMLLAASPAYLRARGTPSQLADLSQHDCLARVRPGQQPSWVLQGPQGREEVMIRGRLYANTVQSLLRAARCGLGIALLPQSVTRADLAEGRLLRVLPQYAQEVGGIYAVFPSRQWVMPAARLWVDFVVEQMGEQLRR